jgi:hypothetical protein
MYYKWIELFIFLSFYSCQWLFALDRHQIWHLWYNYFHWSEANRHIMESENSSISTWKQWLY